MKQQIIALFSAQHRLTQAEFDRYFLDCYSSIAAAAFHLTGNMDEAEDLAAEAFWKLWNNPPRKSDNIPGWLFRVVTNLGYNHLRSIHRRKGYENHGAKLEWDQSRPEDPEEEMIRKQERDGVRQTLRAMSKRDVQILILRSCGLSYKEVAESLGIYPGSVGTLISRAEKKFDLLFRRGEEHALEG